MILPFTSKLLCMATFAVLPALAFSAQEPPNEPALGDPEAVLGSPALKKHTPIPDDWSTPAEDGALFDVVTQRSPVVYTGPEDLTPDVSAPQGTPNRPGLQGLHRGPIRSNRGQTIGQ